MDVTMGQNIWLNFLLCTINKLILSDICGNRKDEEIFLEQMTFIAVIRFILTGHLLTTDQQHIMDTVKKKTVSKQTFTQDCKM